MKTVVYFQELTRCVDPFGALALVLSRLHELGKRSGAFNVANAEVVCEEDWSDLSYTYTVVFDSSAWTGR